MPVHTALHTQLPQSVRFRDIHPSFMMNPHLNEQHVTF